MGKGKLAKFAELEEMDNVFQKPNPEESKGKWNDKFGNTKPIVLELACGKGDYTLALAARFPEKNFIGIDIKGARIHVGARTATEHALDNVRFLRIYIDNIDEYFAPGEVDEIWITFPDPYLKKGKASKRLTSPKFLDLYRKVLKKSGYVQLKTDSPELFEFTKEVIAEQELPVAQLHENVYTEPNVDPLLTEIQTYYEKKHLKDERIIRYVKFQLEK